MKTMISLVLQITLSFNLIYGQIANIPADQRVTKQLDKLEVKYLTNERGLIKVLFNTGTDRSQMVLVASETQEIGGLEIREISSCVAIREKKIEFTKDVLMDLMKSNAEYKIGCWQITEASEVYILDFCMRISANIKAEELYDLIYMTSKIADDKEQEFSDEDEY